MCKCACLLHTACVLCIVAYIILYLISHVYHVLSKLKTLVKLVIQHLELNTTKTRHVHQMIKYANNLILILFNIDDSGFSCC